MTTPAERLKRAATARARTHIKAIADVLREDTVPGDASTPAVFTSGMRTGLASAVLVIDGATAEDALEEVAIVLEKFIDQAVLDVDLPAPHVAPVEGDRVRVSYEATYAKHDDGMHWVKAARDENDVWTNIVPPDGTVEVLEANPKCPKAGCELTHPHLHTRAEMAVALTAGVDSVRQLHRPVDWHGMTICAECSAYDATTDSTDSTPVAYDQCGTLAALNGPKGG